MTLYSVIVLIKLYPEFGNDGYIFMCNFGGSSMNGFETMGDGRAFETRSVGEAKKKGRVWIGLMNAVTSDNESRLLGISPNLYDTLRVDFHCRAIFTCVYRHVNFTRVNRIEAIQDIKCLNVKLREVQLLPLRATFHTLPLFYLRST